MQTVRIEEQTKLMAFQGRTQDALLLNSSLIEIDTLAQRVVEIQEQIDLGETLSLDPEVVSEFVSTISNSIGNMDNFLVSVCEIDGASACEEYSVFEIADDIRENDVITIESSNEQRLSQHIILGKSLEALGIFPVSYTHLTLPTKA